jgi:hypothetical protein
VLAVVQHERRCFSFLSVSYGLITNLDIGTEHLRWLRVSRCPVQRLLIDCNTAAEVVVPRLPLCAAPCGWKEALWNCQHLGCMTVLCLHAAESTTCPNELELAEPLNSKLDTTVLMPPSALVLSFLLLLPATI